METFTDVTELLRHFYSFIGRKGNAAPHFGNEPFRKAEAILKRLNEDVSVGLESKKAKYIVAERSNAKKTLDEMHTFDAEIAALNAVSILIQRAKMSWSIYINSR